MKRCLVKLHRGEEGMETVQIIMILAIAAMVMTGVSNIAGVGGGAAGKETLLGGVGEMISSIFGSTGGLGTGVVNTLFGS